jgi:hypothetical protein
LEWKVWVFLCDGIGENVIDKVGTAKNTKYVLKEQKIGGGKL